MYTNFDFVIYLVTMAAGGERGSGGVGMRYNYLLLYKYSTKDLQKITYHFEAGWLHK